MVVTPTAREIYVFADFRVDRYTRRLLRVDDGNQAAAVLIGSRALDILIVLLARGGDMVSKTEIMDAVWPGLAVEENNLTEQISAIRRALDANRDGPSLIQTAPGRGYRFVGDVRLSLTDPCPAERLPTALVVPAPSAEPRWWVGRAAPIETLTRLFDKARAGSRQIVFITGEAGIGKTTLIDMAAEQLPSRGFGILRARCAEVFGAEEAFMPLDRRADGSLPRRWRHGRRARSAYSGPNLAIATPNAAGRKRTRGGSNGDFRRDARTDASRVLSNAGIPQRGTPMARDAGGHSLERLRHPERRLALRAR